MSPSMYQIFVQALLDYRYNYIMDSTVEAQAARVTFMDCEEPWTQRQPELASAFYIGNKKFPC